MELRLSQGGGEKARETRTISSPFRYPGNQDSGTGNTPSSNLRDTCFSPSCDLHGVSEPRPRDTSQGRGLTQACSYTPLSLRHQRKSSYLKLLVGEVKTTSDCPQAAVLSKSGCRPAWGVSGPSPGSAPEQLRVAARQVWPCHAAPEIPEKLLQEESVHMGGKVLVE